MQSREGVTAIEVEILGLIADELPIAEIAERLGVEMITVRILVDHLMFKTETRSIIGLMKESLRRGWIS